MLLVGGYTTNIPQGPKGKARGISAYDFFPTDGRIEFLGFTPALDPSYLLTDRKRSIVYAVQEVAGNGSAGVTAHKISRNNRGKIKFELISDFTLASEDPCHLAFAGNTLLVSSFSSGHLHVIERQEDGRLGAELQTVTLEASKEGKMAHAHCALLVPKKNWVLVCDLGNDLLKVYDRAEDGTLTGRPELDLPFQEGHGPRHIALHPEGDLAVVNGENVGQVHLIDVSGDRPLRATTANALPERVIEEASGAAIRFGSSGKMIYTSDRTFSVVTVLRVDERGKKLVVRDTFPSGGESPRDLIVSPNDQWLLTANTHDSTVGVFRIDPRGGLVHHHTFRKVPSPSSLAWL
ncbi:lactonase family protein [Neolewinella persica]|uniref:lactonase family protein n=1 Tax=Neolewinella persica TaxID=70998 RepID=UPI00037B88E7|nr:beta-propeller fold lactonase family protein [Neolewinella persica]